VKDRNRTRDPGPLSGALLIALVLYVAASFIHHAHNARFLLAYPNMPEGLSSLGIYSAWAVVTLVGVVGVVLLRKGFEGPGLMTLAIYGACGLYGLAHYVVADFTALTAAMHATIWFEVLSGSSLIVLSMRNAMRSLRQRTPSLR